MIELAALGRWLTVVHDQTAASAHSPAITKVRILGESIPLNEEWSPNGKCHRQFYTVRVGVSLAHG
jgi:hypothetical protein